MTAPIRERLCCAIYPAPDIDCLCLQPEHDPDVPHLCDAPGCGREWADTPRRAA